MSEENLSIIPEDYAGDGLPPVLVNKDLLKPYFINRNTRYKHAAKTVYQINDSLFEDNEEYDERDMKGDTVEFEVYAERNDEVVMTDEDDCCSSLSDDEDDVQDKALNITIREVENGIIINSNVYLTNHQWHTITFVDIKRLKCAICQMFCNLDSCDAHMSSAIHVNNLNEYKPLDKYDLSITRKIQNKYHCGVCNELFDITDSDVHFSTKTHEDNLLFAINKVSDLMYDNNMNENANSIGKKRPTSRNGFHWPSNQSNPLYESSNALYESSNALYESSNSPFESSNGCHDKRRNNDDLHFGPNLTGDYDDIEFEYDEPIKGTSYAKMAMKPKTHDTPEYLKMDLGNKTVTIKFDSWHMIIHPKLNRFYCMVCQKEDHVRFKTTHCGDAEHLDKLSKCKDVEGYEDYLIRIVDEKLYHCGHCNNLRVIPDMASHIEMSHPKKTKNIIDIQTLKNVPIKNKDFAQNSNMNNKTDPKRNSDDKQTECSNNRTINDNKNEAGIMDSNTLSTPDIHSNIVIYPFGYKLNIPILAYNIVFENFAGYYCRLCDVAFKEDDVNNHIYSVKHIEVLQRTPFILPFSSHLIRAVRDSFHCGICNVLVTPDKIYEHNVTQIHTSHLATALGIVHKSTNDSKTNIQSGPNNEAEVTPNVAPNKVRNPIVAPVNRPHVPPFGSLKNSTAITPSNCTILPTSVPQTRFNAPNVIPKPNSPQSSIPPKPSSSFTQIPSTSQPIPSFNKPVTKQADIEQFGQKNDIKKSNEPSTSIIEKNSKMNETHSKINEPHTKINEPHSKINEPHSKINEPNPKTNETKPEINERHSDVNETVSDLNESFEACEDTFDAEEHVYIKLKNIYFRISLSSYNTLVQVGDGSRYCFVCSLQIDKCQLGKHAESRGHTENIDKYKFLDKPEEHLLRQIYLMYHCSVCNVLISGKELKNHLDWTTHASYLEETHSNVKKLRKNELKYGIKEYAVATQKETIFLQGQESKLKISFNFNVVDNQSTPVPSTETLEKNKMVIFNNQVLKIPHYSWNGVVRMKNDYKCVLCQKEIGYRDVEVHMKTEYHESGLGRPFERHYYPALIREVNDNFANCVTCNTEIPNRDSNIFEHIKGRKHIKNYQNVQKSSLETNDYTDCYADVLIF